MRYIATGGAGLARTLQKHNHDAVIIDNLATVPGRVKIEHPPFTFTPRTAPR